MSVTDWVTIGCAVVIPLIGLILKLSHDRIEANKRESDEKLAELKKNAERYAELLHGLEIRLHAQQIEFLNILTARRSERALENQELQRRMDTMASEANERREKLAQLLADMRETAASFQAVYVTRNELLALGIAAAPLRLAQKHTS